MGKRLVDIVAGTILSLIVLPFIVLFALGVCVSLRTLRPFFVQERVGQRAKPFWIIKLRTLPRSTFPYALKGKASFKETPRFTRWLRRTHLDELPQIFLVPLGLMSLVGPRPKMPDDFEPVNAEYGSVRVLVPQGCTGLWQIGVHADDAPDHAPQYDFFYLEHSSLRLDLWILLKTGAMMLGLSPRAELLDVPQWALRRSVPSPAFGDTGHEMIHGTPRSIHTSPAE